ncbi:MAG: FAD-dependent oxidoreductase [Paracoccaceae bacterium]|nr:FAD-dependent oxidoreductase [Paracoccaceae bacterium]
MADSNYSILFEPLKIGPVTARNRFFQVPHCNGMGHLRPQADAATRAIKAEGGWAVVCNQETEIHPSSDLTPFPEGRLWDERDIPALRLMTESVHKHGALAAIELAHNGNHAGNLSTRSTSFAPTDMAIDLLVPKQARAMDKSDIRNLRQWHRAAALRAKEAGFDIIYVYAGHHMALAQHFLLPKINDRMDEYGGSLENRARLIQELIEDTKEAVGDSCAVAFRFAVDEMEGIDGMQAAEEGRAVVEMLAELPDLWDVNVSDWSNDSATTRFAPNEGYQTPYIDFVRQVTSKPVVAVGRFTSPDLMASMVKNGIIDFIGSARPSIADPFLPEKIRTGRIDEIRECIGCNICVASDNMAMPIRCTQNPTMGEEWRRGWHPEKIAPKGAENDALVIGAGPAGLECAMQLAKRGYEVTLAEASDETGGRVRLESQLLGLGAWKRVVDHRLYDLNQRANVQLFTQSPLALPDVLELGIGNVFIATGAKWRRDGVGRSARQPIPISDAMTILTADDIMAGKNPTDGPVLIYDDDQIYLAGVLAEHLSEAGYNVVFTTPASMVSPWTENTLEQAKIQKVLLERGVALRLGHKLTQVCSESAELSCIYTGQTQRQACATVVLVTERHRQSRLYDDLRRHQAAHPDSLRNLSLIGDAAAPGLIADAVYSGHLAARDFEKDAKLIEEDLFRREIISLKG